MPNETQQAIDWALQQYANFDGEIVPVKGNPVALVDKVREYFNTNNIEYSTFSYNDIIPFL